MADTPEDSLDAATKAAADLLPKEPKPKGLMSVVSGKKVPTQLPAGSGITRKSMVIGVRG